MTEVFLFELKYNYNKKSEVSLIIWPIGIKDFSVSLIFLRCHKITTLTALGLELDNSKK